MSRILFTRTASCITFVLMSATALVVLLLVPRSGAGGQTIPNDPKFSSQWSLPKVGAPQAWDRTQGSAAVKVAVVGTGVTSNLPDLQGQLGPAYNAISPGGTTQDDFGTYGDGTAAAGVIGAVTNNGVDMAGVAWRVTLLPVKVCDLTGNCPNAALANGINWAVTNGAQIVNIGVALNPTASSSDVTAAVSNALARGVLVVASAGNYAGYVGYPANLSGVIAVGSTDATDTVASFSGRGSQLSLVAPGVSVMSLARQGCCISFTGSEFAAAHVSGSLALLLGAGVPASQAASALYRGAKDLGAVGRDVTYGWGRLDVCGALAAAGIACPVAGSSPPPTPVPTNTPIPTATKPVVATATGTATATQPAAATATRTATATHIPATATAVATPVHLTYTTKLIPSSPSADNRISCVAGRSLHGSVTWSGSSTLAMTAYSPTAGVVGYGTGSSGSITLSLILVASGTYDFRVALVSGGATTYNLSLWC